MTLWWIEKKIDPKGSGVLLGGVAFMEEMCHCGDRL